MPQENDKEPNKQELLFDNDTPKPETPVEAAARLKRMSEPSVHATVEVASGFPEERTLGDDLNPYTPEEGEEINRLISQGLSFPNAFQQATKRVHHDGKKHSQHPSTNSDSAKA